MLFPPSPSYFDVCRPLKLIVFVQKPFNSSAGITAAYKQATSSFCCFTCCRGKVPEVDIRHVKCYPPYLFGRWIFMSLDTGVSLQPAVQPAAALQSSNRPDPSTSFQLSFSQTSPIFLRVTFLTRWWFCLERGAMLLLDLRCCGTSQLKHPVKKTRKRSGYNPMFHTHAHLLPLTPLGTRSDLCRDPDSRFALAHAFPFCSEETAPNSMRITRAFGRPSRCSASSRLPLTVVWQRRRAAVWGQAHLAWQQRLQRLSH